MEDKSTSSCKINSKMVRGCIKATRGPWIVQRRTKKGVVTSLRFPTEREREKNKERERRRREITRRIYAGLRVHGNYNLPKYADNNDLLRALCAEAGWLVHEDGSLSRKNVVTEIGDPKSKISSIQICANGGCVRESPSEDDANLTLSLSLPSYD